MLHIILLLMLAVANPALAQVVNDETDAINYSHGFATGGEMRKLNIDLRVAAFSAGLYDALENKTPRLSEELMTQLTSENNTNLQNQDAPQGFRLPGQKYISENASQGGVITLPSGVQYKVLKSGDGVETPNITDTVLVNYKATTIDGKPFSSTYPLGIPTPQELAVSEGIEGLTEALLLMHEGDQWVVTIPYHLAYRDNGPMAGQTVIFEIELIRIYRNY